ncbi:MAG: penicillin-binding protein 1A [Cyclobacteriaceae bacterium]
MTNKSKIRAFIILLWLGFIVTFTGIFSVFYMVNNDVNGWFGGLPSLSSLEKPDPDLSSELISADGVSLGKYYRKNRTPVTYRELSPELINTLLVTEDYRFKQHSGIDLRGLARAVIGKITFNFQGGGSTLTMQLAENLYKTNSSNKGSLYDYPAVGQIITKLKEWIIAVQLERSYTKEEILAMYLNTIEYGSNSYGIKVAAETFFNKLPSELDYQEAASLVGSINKPTAYNPVYNPERAKNKRTEVLYNVYKYGLISRKTYDSLKEKPLTLQYKVDNHNEGLATYFRTVVRNDLLKWSRENGYDLFEDGLKIYTTIDSRMQEYAENAVNKHMDTLQQIFYEHLQGDDPWINEDGQVLEDFIDNETKRLPYYKSLSIQFEENEDSIDYYLNLPKPMKVFSWQGEIDTVLSTVDSLRYFKHFLQAGFMVMEPNSGHIKAWVGGINHKYFKYDHVRYGKRQPGSTFKPIVYTAAIDNGYSPCQTAVDAATTYTFPGQDPPVWQPENANGKYSGEVMTLRKAMAKSVNSITAWVMQKIGPQTVVEYARRLGIESRLAAVPSLSLGAGGDVSIYELVGAYGTFVNKGVYTKPYFISRIEDENGNIIQQFIPETKEALNEETAYIMLNMLKGTTEPGGTAQSLEYFLLQDNDIGGKTGTTQNASDGWFMGVTKDLVAGAWVGGDNRAIRFKSWVLGQGGRTAMPIYENFMLDIYNDPTLPYTRGEFDRPLTSISIELDCSLYNDVSANDTTYYEQINEDDIF